MSISAAYWMLEAGKLTSVMNTADGINCLMPVLSQLHQHCPQALCHPCPQGRVQQRRHLLKSFRDTRQQGVHIVFRLPVRGAAETGVIAQHGVARDVADGRCCQRRR